MVAEWHKEAERRLFEDDPTLKKGGLGKFLRAQDLDVRSPRIIPDGWKVEPINEYGAGYPQLVCVEVVHTSWPTPEKWVRYADFWFGLDCESWSLAVEIYDRNSALVLRVRDRDLTSVWYAKLSPGELTDEAEEFFRKLHFHLPQYLKRITQKERP
jgi:hypothetical protein